MSTSGAALPEILIVAIGNPDRGDDGAGALVAARLAGRLPPGVAVVTRRGDMLSLIEDWAGINAVICIDAASPMGEPGRVERIDAGAGRLPRGVSFASSHAFGLAEAIALAGALRSLPGSVIVYAIEGACFEGGAVMTPDVTAAAAKVADLILDEIVRLRPHAGKVVSDARGGDVARPPSLADC